ncbi:hypothetical protein Pcinc_019926 [Petrolisthes cinctipes]|uniref:HTH CENPB-type domain-containing protein n=1 Tax=Petrolisthes cinctipes TaxID=88211 RepID=A0AAE1FKA7_PETCI|nr:hypothetical protein Pcinc_019926 [Petrolisthes cinctipes]
MAKRPAISPPAAAPTPKKRKRVSLAVKLDIIKRNESGQGPSEIGRALGLSASTVGTILKNAPRLKEVGESVTPTTATKLSRSRDCVMENMERLLSTWIEDCNQRNMPLCLKLIQEKALSLWKDLQEKQQPSEDTPQAAESFNASRGWFNRFKKRANLHNIKVTGEAASADLVAANAYPAQLQDIIEKGGYIAKQVFNIDETGLCWKRMPSRTYIAQEEKTAPGFKAAKDRLTLLLGGNAEGDVKLKPMLIYQSENPRALKGIAKNQLPVIWRCNKKKENKSRSKAWMTSYLFEDYVKGYFSNYAKKYCEENNLRNKVLLLVDNAPGHPEICKDWCENVEVQFLPPNTTSLIQPMDQGVIATFKAYYLRRTIQQLIKETDRDNKLSVQQYWKNFNIKKCLDNIRDAWEEVSPSTMNGVWKKIWPECIYGFKGFPQQSILTKEIVMLAQQAGFEEVDENDVTELLESHNEELTNEDLMELEQERAHEDDDDDDQEESVPPKPKQLTLKGVRRILDLLGQATAAMAEEDPNQDRVETINENISKNISCYNEIERNLKQQATQPSILAFFQKKNAATTNTGTAASPSTSTTTTAASPSTTDSTSSEGMDSSDEAGSDCSEEVNNPASNN